MYVPKRQCQIAKLRRYISQTEIETLVVWFYLVVMVLAKQNKKWQ